MMHHGSRLRQIGWAVALTLCITLFLALTFRVNATKSDVRLAEREIIALERETTMLEIEFQTRASQQQLANYNRVEFGYRAPTAAQYLENERQVASLGMPRGVGAPDPIRVARGPTGDEPFALSSFVSPLTGRPIGDGSANPKSRDADTMRTLAERLAVDNPLRSSASASASVADIGE